MINRIIKNFCFDEDMRNEIALSDPTKIRLNTENAMAPGIHLKADALNFYPLDDDIYFETPFLEPMALKKWLLFEPIYESQQGTLDLPEGTSLGFKVKTTAGNYYWDGANWVIAGASDWNTESEIRLNISTFPIPAIGNKKIGFVVNLKTTDKTVTPKVSELKLLGEFDIEFFDDLVYDTILRLLNLNFRSTSVVQFYTDSSSSSAIDLATILENKGYNIFDVASVYNLTDDPLKLSNLHDSYAPGSGKQDGFTFEAGIETFSAPIPVDKLVEVTFIYVPEISVKVNQDYYEKPSYPHIVFNRITAIDKKGLVMRNTNSSHKDFIRDKENDMAVVHDTLTQQSYRFDFTLYTGEIDQFRLTDGIRRFFANVKNVITYGLANKHNLLIVDEIDTVGNSLEEGNDSSGTNLSKGAFDIEGVVFYDKPSKDVPLITSLGLNIGRQTL
jgi:hypothetical protein